MRRPAETSEETDSVSIDQYLATTPLARDVLACLTDVDSLTRDNLLGEVVQWGARDSTDHERVRIAIRLRTEVLPRFIAEDYVVHEADEYTVGFLPPAAYDAIEER